HAHGLGLHVGADDGGVELHEVAEVAVEVQRVDGEAAAAAGEVRGDLQVGAAGLAQGEARDLAPELHVAVPVDPVGGPLVLGVGGEGDGLAQAVAPVGEQRVVVVRAQRDGGELLVGGDDV